ncbi:hypothetical protein P5673_017874 [Acropora cervicornis]|uniref:Uncharacterized protein n=1 Tax=Acropora cervicornis TaxID=6130 RepID=A0AAD9QEG6_ACRCE|nr:hypothetical protein P5673_017874 [Acropora cervicornis]
MFRSENLSKFCEKILNYWCEFKLVSGNESMRQRKDEILSNHDGIVDHTTCNSCNDKEQTLHHLLIDSTSTSRFWTLFKEWWN